MANGPVPYTCPDIDNCLDLVQGAFDTAKELENLLGRTGLLEKLRAANEALRSWGSEQEERADQLETALGICQERLEQAQEDLKDLQQQLDSALLE